MHNIFFSFGVEARDNRKSRKRSVQNTKWKEREREREKEEWKKFRHAQLAAAVASIRVRGILLNSSRIVESYTEEFIDAREREKERIARGPAVSLIIFPLARCRRDAIEHDIYEFIGSL